MILHSCTVVLAIDPGTSTLTQMSQPLLKGEVATEWYQSTVLPVGFEPLGLDKPFDHVITSFEYFGS